MSSERGTPADLNSKALGIVLEQVTSRLREGQKADRLKELLAQSNHGSKATPSQAPHYGRTFTEFHYYGGRPVCADDVSNATQRTILRIPLPTNASDALGNWASVARTEPSGRVSSAGPCSMML